jgi:urease accessory protein
MVIREKIGNINSYGTVSKEIDWLPLEWHEYNKRILHKKTLSGKEVVMKFIQENQQLTQGDILFEDDSCLIVVDITECDAIIMKPGSIPEAANICYEIGNKHLPLFYCNDEFLVEYDAPLFRLLEKNGHNISTGKRKLMNPLKTTVAQHMHINDSEFLFTKPVKQITPAP